MATVEQLVDVIQRWHTTNVGELQKILDHPEASIRFQGYEAEEVELTEEQAKGFRVGIRMALQYLGELPFTVHGDEEE